MAHKYADFASAFDDLESKWSTLRIYYNSANDLAYDVYDNCPSPPTQYWVKRLAQAVINLCIVPYALLDLGETASDQSHFFESIYWASQEGGGELTWDALLNLMLQAEPENIAEFIGYVDAYRMSLWNKPFNYEFYAALARGFL